MSKPVQWALMWKRGCAFPHIETLESALSKYRANYRDDREPNGWVPLYVGTQDECSVAADSIRGTLIEREPSEIVRELISRI